MPGVGIDTLSKVQGYGLPYDSLFPGMSHHLCPAVADTASVEAEVQAVDLFGPQSVVASTDNVWPVANDLFLLTDNLVFELLVVLIFIGYCYTIYYFREPVAALLKIGKSQPYGEKLMAEHGYMFSQFLHTALIVGLLAVCVSIVRCAELTSSPLLRMLPGWTIPLLTIGCGVGVLLVVCFQRLVLRVAGFLTQDVAFTDHLFFLRQLLAAFSVIIWVPVVLLWVLNEGTMSDVLLYLVVTEFIMILIFWLYKTCQFFLCQKVSILHWFLYLCGVEIFPISVFVLLVLRNG